MLASVHIENIALIKSLSIDFLHGFSAFTGETGAGKSIVIDSIGMACGAKVTKDIIRTGESEARVEALFCELSESAEKNCAGLGVFPDEDGCIFIARSLGADGKGAVTVNGKRIPQSMLREFAPFLINIHGQHDNADLLNSEKHIHILDAFAENEAQREEYAEKYAKYCDIKKSIEKLSVDDMEKKRLTDILKYQIDEIKAAKLKDGEEEKLKNEKKRLRFSEKINKNAGICYRSLYDSENGRSAVDSIERALSAMNELDGIVEGAALLAERLENAKYEIIDIAETANDFCDELADDPTAALDRIESRLEKISRLCSRYGADIAAVNRFCEECENKLSDIELSDERIKELEKQKADVEKQLSEAAERLFETRKAASERLSQGIEGELLYLDMKSARFKTEFTKLSDFSPEGMEKVEFLIKTNSGEGFHPLSKTASGGELSRIMLAIKSVLSEKDGAGTLIFDEIDTGISGSTSRRIGIKLKQLAEKKQVLCVTHSAQVASLADCHYKISKHSEGERTFTGVETLSYDERVREIARIISGMDISEASVKSAKELIDGCDE